MTSKQELRDEIDMLRRRVENQRVQVVALSDTIINLAEERDRSREYLRVSEAEYATLLEEYESKREQMALVEVEAADWEASYEKTNELYIEAQDNLANVSHELMMSYLLPTEEIDELERDLADLEFAYSVREEKIAELEKQLSEALEDRDLWRSDYEELERLGGYLDKIGLNEPLVVADKVEYPGNPSFVKIPFYGKGSANPDCVPSLGMIDDHPIVVDLQTLQRENDILAAEKRFLLDILAAHNVSVPPLSQLRDNK